MGVSVESTSVEHVYILTVTSAGPPRGMSSGQWDTWVRSFGDESAGVYIWELSMHSWYIKQGGWYYCLENKHDWRRDRRTGWSLGSEMFCVYMLLRFWKEVRGDIFSKTSILAKESSVQENLETKVFLKGFYTTDHFTGRFSLSIFNTYPECDLWPASSALQNSAGHCQFPPRQLHKSLTCFCFHPDSLKSLFSTLQVERFF